MSKHDALRIYQNWHDYARTKAVDDLLHLYAEDAVLESPLVPAILGYPSGILRGHEEIGHFLREGTKRRPNPLVRWYRTDQYFYQDGTLIWEYPRQTPEGDQVDILELMELRASKIQNHRIYWGWFGCKLIAPALAKQHTLS